MLKNASVFNSAFDEAKKWQDVADALGTQDFCYSMLEMRAADGDIKNKKFILFDYGLGDNDFGSMSLIDRIQPSIWVTDGDWSPAEKSNVTDQELSCLENAVASTACFQRDLKQF